MKFELCGNLYVPAHMRAVPYQSHKAQRASNRRAINNKGYEYCPPVGGGGVETHEIRCQVVIERETWAKLDTRRRINFLETFSFDMTQPVELNFWKRTAAEWIGIDPPLVPGTEKNCDILEYIQRW
jgi:hypothetical protein